MKIIGGVIPVRIHPFFLILVGLISALQSQNIPTFIIWALVIFYSVLIHEYGHALTALYFGQKSDITLTAFGGLTTRKDAKKLKSWQEFLIVLNGPLAGFLLFVCAFQIIGYIAATEYPYLYYALQITVAANLFWTIVNLLPIFPLDGGHLLKIFLEGLFGARGIKISLFFSFSFSALATAFFLYFSNIIGAAIFLLFTFESFRAWKDSLSLTEWDRDPGIQEQFKKGEKAFLLHDYDKAKTIFEEVSQSAEKGMIHFAASEELAKIYVEEQEYDKAYELLQANKNQLSPESIRLLHFVSFKKGNYRQAAELGHTVYQNLPSYDIAMINAMSHAALGEVVPSVGWLRCAISEGYPNPKQVFEKKEFEQIANDPNFQELRNKYNHS